MTIRSLYDMGYYGIIIGVIALLILLIFLREVCFPLKKEKRNRFCTYYDVGNAQIQGVKEEQNDYFSVCSDRSALLIALADGRSDYIEGKYSAVFAVETLKQNFKAREKYGNSKKYFQMSFGDIIYGLSKREFSHTTRTSVACALLCDKKISWALVGSSKVYLYRKRSLIDLNGETKVSQTMGELKLRKQDLLLFCTKGVLECLAEYEIIHLLSGKQTTHEKAEAFADYISRQGYIHQANATVIVVEVAGGGRG